MSLTEEQKVAYLRRCFAAVDGLWFVKLEECLGFEEALAIDEAVWRIMPKIQARWFKEATGLTAGLDAFAECFRAKLELDGFAFQCAREDRTLLVTVGRCPWHERMIASKREALSGTVGDHICPNEYGIWAQEFSSVEESLSFRLVQQICHGEDTCVLAFTSG